MDDYIYAWLFDIKTSIEEIETLFAKADITSQEAYAAIERLGLKILTEEQSVSTDKVVTSKEL